MSLVIALQLLQKEPYQKVFPRLPRCYPMNLNHTRALLTPEQQQYCHVISYIKNRLSQNRLPVWECDYLKKFLLRSEGSLLNDWLILLIWHLRYTFNNKALFLQLIPQQEAAYRQECCNIENKYLALCSAFQELTFFPAYLLYGEYLLEKKDTNGLRYIITVWEEMFIPDAAALLLQYGTKDLPKKIESPNTKYLLTLKEHQYYLRLFDWLKYNSSQYAITRIEESIMLYLQNPHNVAVENEIINACVKQTERFGNLLGYYYLGLFYYATASLIDDASERYERYKLSCGYLLSIKQQVIPSYSYRSQLFDMEKTLAKNIILFAEQFTIAEKKILPCFIPAWVAHRLPRPIRAALLPDGLLLAHLSSVQKASIKAMVIELAKPLPA